MKITFVLGTVDMSGGTRVVATYTKRLMARGHDVTVVSTPRQRLPLRSRLRSLSRGQGWPPHQPRQWASYLDNSGIPHRVIDRCRPILAADVPDADVVIATWWETAEWVNPLPPEKGAKAYLIQHHEVLFDGQPRDRVAATWRMPMHKIVISRWLKELAEQEYGTSDLTLIPNSVDTEQFHAPPRGRQASPTVGMLYNTNARFKGCEVSLEAIRQVAAGMPDLRLICFGNEPQRAHLPLPPGTHYVQSPPQAAIKDLYAQCDVWVCGSHSEGFGLTVLESMACRCPAVSTRVGGPIDFIEEGVNGHLVDVGDCGALADRLRRVLELPESRWRAMSDAAYETAISYTWDDATSRLENALESLCRNEVTAALNYV